MAVSLVAGAFTFYWCSVLDRWRSSVLILDAAGLSLFAVSGALKALAFGLNPMAAATLGVLTGIGGGIVRDLLVAEVPTVLRSEFYATAALTGASILVIGSMLGIASTATALTGAAACFTLRVIAIRRGWGLPVAGEVGRSRRGTRGE
jgi:uncharacterized membrane protein YeiH